MAGAHGVTGTIRPASIDAPRRDVSVGPDFQREVVCIAGIAFDVETVAGAAERVRTAIRDGVRLHLATPNMSILRLTRGDAAVRDALLASDLCIADGMPIIWLARLQGTALPERASGADVFEHLRAPTEWPIRVHFFGGFQEHVSGLHRSLNAPASGLRCVGTTTPGSGDVAQLSEPALLDQVNASRPDLVAVAVSARKGLLWIGENERRLKAAVIAYLGATIDFAAGTLRRAPPWMRRSGMEWLWRVTQQPKLAGRYAADLGVLLLLAVDATLLSRLARAAHRTLPDAPAGIRIEHLATGRVLVLRGAWRGRDLAGLRAALASLARLDEDLAVDLSECQTLDPAVLGLLLLARGHQVRVGRAFELGGARPSLRVFLRAHGCGYLLRQRSAAAMRHTETPDRSRSRAVATTVRA